MPDPPTMTARPTLTEPSRNVPVRDEVEVLVAGGGLGGVSAAVAAARAGAKTLLIERNGFPGGVATAGMCRSLFNCLYTPSHELVVRGPALEFVEELAGSGPGEVRRDHRGHIIFDVERGKLALIELLDIPYRCLRPRTVEGLLMGSGRSVSAENPFLLRAMALTMVIGQGAGVAAAVCARDGSPPRAVNMVAVRDELARQGMGLT